MGAVVPAFDMVGYADSGKIGWDHETVQTMPLNLLAGIRGLDYLLSLDDVDPERVAVTGASGGGTQSFLLTAIDSCVKVSAPVCMVSAHFFGGCICESGRPIHKTSRHETNNVDIAAVAAPRPQLLVSVGGDWTANTPEVEYPYLQSVYSLYDAADRIVNAHFPEEGHNYRPSKRKAMYKFFVEHLGLDADQVDDDKVVIESREKMASVNDEHPLPKRALHPSSKVSW